MATTIAIAACSNDVKSVDDDDGSGGSGASTGNGGSGATIIPTSNKVDVLLVVDNSRAMEDAQEILAQSVPSLLDGLAAQGVADVHVGVVSSSLGGQGADACSQAVSPTENDRGHLISRGVASTYGDLGFLAWDPNLAKTPAGEANIDTVVADTQALIRGAGGEGCGYESPLESFYRFLIDPDPYLDVTLENAQAVLSGTDTQLLQMRADFTRPDSLVMVVLLTDENDCSTRDGGQFYFSRQVYQQGTNSPYHLPYPRAACSTDPNGECCRSCGQEPGPGCDTSADNCGASLSALDDNINLRCYDQKRRFGIDFLWPMDRYEEGLSSSQIQDRYGNVVDNPLFMGGRSPQLVVVGSIVGVPWQLANRDGDPSAGAQTGAEIAAAGAWTNLIGDPDAYVPPTDPHMIEAVDPRGGLPGPASAVDADPIHGHDFSVPQRDDLQYACTWDLANPRDCTGQQNCECNNPMNDNPVCQDSSGGAFGATQFRAPARPGIRPLQLMKSLNERGVVGSICPAQTSDPSAADYGYVPVFATLLELADERLE